MPTLESVDEIDGPVDAAFIAVKREPTIEIVRALRAKGCGGAVIYASGFAETGDAHLQDASCSQAADGMPLMGPNCYGFVNALAAPHSGPTNTGSSPSPRGVAIITQSGNIACNFTMTRRGLPVAAVLCHRQPGRCRHGRRWSRPWPQDPRITAIGLHIEGLPDVAGLRPRRQASPATSASPSSR